MNVTALLITVFYLLLFNFILFRIPKLQFKNFKPIVTPLLFNIKFITGILIWGIYTFYYKDLQNNDIHKFYNDALVLRQAANESPKDFLKIVSGVGAGNDSLQKYYTQMKNWERNFDEAPFNENRTVIRLNALLLFLSNNTYFVHILFMCFFSLVGWVLLTNSILNFTSASNSVLTIPIMLLPSVLFWTSGVMKEPVLVLGLGIFFWGLLQLNSPLIKRICAIAIGTLIMLMIKFFVLVCLIPALIAYLLFQNIEDTKKVVLKYAAINLVLLVLAFSVHFIIPRINLQQMLINKQMHSVKEAIYFNAGSRIDIPEATNTAGIVTTIPVGVWNTLLRPYLWEGKNIMMLASALENALIIIFIATCIWFSYAKQFKNWNLLLLLLNFALAYFALVGMCTPVLGNLVRYKAPLLPVFLLAFVLIFNPQYIPKELRNFLLTREN